ncbi:MAG: hypothetical protein QXK88_01160 [Desulfurococcaceae archaeon]
MSANGEQENQGNLLIVTSSGVIYECRGKRAQLPSYGRSSCKKCRMRGYCGL